MRLLAYVRVSTDDQARGGHSIARQPDLIRAWCTAQGHTLVDVIVDGDFGDGSEGSQRGVSAGRPLDKREGGAQLLARLRSGEAEGVVVYSVFRLFRDTLDALLFFRRFAQPRGVQVFSLSEAIDVARASGRLALTVLLATAEYERDTTRERTAAIAQGLREQGRVFGTVPYGCVARGGQFDSAQGKLVGQQLFREPVAWAMRESIVALRREGGYSLGRISDTLRRARTPAPNGGVRWSKSTLSELIRTHDSLTHLPLLQDEGRAATTAAPDALASPTPPQPVTRH